MAEVDTSIYGNIARVKPLETINSLAATATAITEAQKARLGLQGQISLGRAAQGAMDPTTGNVDTNALIRSIYEDPEGFAAAPAAAELAPALRTAQAGAQKAQQDLMQAGFVNLGGAWGARLAQGGILNSDDFENDAIDLFTQGRMPPELFKEVVRGMPSDPDELKKYVTGGYIQSLPPSMTAAAYPAAPGSGGAPRQQLGGQFIQESLEGAPTVSRTAPGVTTGLSPAATQALSSTGESNAAMGQSLISLANQVPERMALLQNMEADVEEFTAGPPSETIRKLVASTNSLFGTSFDLEGVAAKERFDKLASQIAVQQAGAMGTSTDQKLATVMGANPHSGMSNLGIRGNIALLKGNEDAIRVKGAAWNQYLVPAQDGGGSGSPEQFGAWSTAFNKMYDPRVFQSVYLTPDESKKMLGAMSATERKQFKEKYNFAIRNGWIPDPRKPLEVTVTKGMAQPDFEGRFND